MAGNPRISLIIQAEGANEALKSLRQLQAEMQKAAAAAKGINSSIDLGKNLGQSFKSAEAFAAKIGLTSAEAASAVKRLGELDKAGATTRQNFAALSKEFGLTRSQFNALNTAYSNTSKSTEKLAQSLGTSFDAARKFSKETGLSASRAAEAVDRYRALSAVSADLATKQSVLTKEFGLTANQFTAIRGAALTSQQGLAGLVGIAGTVSAALGSIAQQGIQAFAEFDSKIRTFGVIAEATPKQVEAVRTEIERLGTSTQKTPGEVADLGTELAKAGFKAKQVKDALGGIVLASQATGEDLQRTGEVIGNIINQFQLKAGDSNRIADLLVATSNASASGVNDLGEALSYAGTQSKQSNQSLEDTLLALGQLANAGIKGSSAGTGLAEALRRLKLASANAGTEFDELKSKGAKGAVEAFKKVNESVRDSRGQLLPLPQILKNLKSGLQGVAQGDQDLINNALFGVQGGRVIQTLLNGNVEQTSNLATALQNASGSAKRAGEALSQGPLAGLKQLQASTTVALVRVGELVSVAFLPLIDVSQLLLTTFNALPAPLQGFVVGIGGVAAALAAATAAVSTYNLAKGSAIVTETLAAAATVKDTIAKGTNLAITKGAAIAQQALALANTTVTASTIAAGFAEAFRTGKTIAGNAVTVISTALTQGQTGALLANASAAFASGAAFSAMIVPLLGIAAAIGGAVVAIGLFNARFKAFEPANKIKAAREEFQKFRAESDKEYALKLRTEQAEKKVRDLADAFALFQKNIGERGAVEGTLASIDTILTQSFGSTSKYGESFGYINQQQFEAQQTMLALDSTLNEMNGLFDSGTNLINRYGLAQVDAADKTRLGADGIKRFQTEGAKQVEQIEAGIDALKKSSEAVKDPQQKQLIEAQIKNLESQKSIIQKRAAALTGDSNALKTNADKAKANAKAQEELKKKLDNIKDIGKRSEAGQISDNTAVQQLEAIRKSAGKEVEVRRAASEEILKIRKKEIDSINNLLDTGQISQGDALSQLQALQSASAGNPEAAKQAADAILKIKKDQIDAEIALIQAGQASIEALQANGNIGEAKAAEEISALKEQEVRKRIELNQEELQAALNPAEREKLKAEEKKLQAELTKIQAAERDRRNKERLKDYDEQLKLLEASFQKGQQSEESYLAQRQSLQTGQADEELRQQRDALTRLQSDDREGREAINATIAEIEVKKVKILEESQKRQVELLKERQAEALALVQESEQERLIAIQQGVNRTAAKTRAIESQAEQARLQARGDALQQELQLAQQLEQALAQQTASSPEGIKALEKEKQDARSKTNALTLSLLENESQQQEKIKQVAIEGINQELAKRKLASDKAIAGFELEAAAADRVSKAIDRQSQLLQARANLQKALSDLQQTEGQIALTNVDRALEIRKQLDSGSVKSTEERIALEQELARLGFSGASSTQQILQAKFELENRLAAQKKAALLSEQAQQRQALVLEQQRNTIAANRAVIEAKIAQSKAQQAVLDAQAGLREAQIGGDPQAIAQAQQALDLAKQQADLANQNTQDATQQQQQIQETNQLQNQVLQAQQQAALKQFEAAEAARQNAQALESARANAEALAAAAEREAAARERGAAASGRTSGTANLPGRFRGGNVAAGQAYVVGEREPEVFVPGVSGTILNQQQIARNLSALQAAQAIGGHAPTSIGRPAVVVNAPDRAVLKELQQIRQQLKNAKTENTFMIEKNGEDEYRRMAQIAAIVNRSKWR